MTAPDAIPDEAAYQRKGMNPFLPDAPVRKTFDDEGVMRSIESWRDAEREKESWRDGDTQTYRYRANLLEASLVRWRNALAGVERLTGVVDEQRRVIEETADLVLRPVADMWTGRDAFMPVKVIEGARRLLTALDAADSRPSQQSGGEG